MGKEEPQGWAWSLEVELCLSCSRPWFKPITKRDRKSESAFHPAALPEVADGGGCILSELRNHYIILPTDSLGTNDLPMTYTQARTEPFSAVAA